MPTPEDDRALRHDMLLIELQRHALIRARLAHISRQNAKLASQAPPPEHAVPETPSV